MQTLNFLISSNFWSAFKIGVDILQSVIISLATVIGGIWAIKTFGYSERLQQLEKLNRHVLNLRDTILSLYWWSKTNALAGAAPSSNQALENMIYRAQAELKDTFNTSMRIDFFKKGEWESDLSPYTYGFPLTLITEETKKEMERAITKVSVAIVTEAHFRLPKWLRWLDSKLD